MALNVNVRCTGTGNIALVQDDGSLQVTNNGFPVPDAKTLARPFRQYFTDTGLSTGDNDMRVVGSSTNVLEFSISASGEGKDRYLSTLSVVIADQSATLNKFGNITALTNGITLGYSDENGEVTIADSLKTNWDFIRLGLGTPPIGSTADAFRANNVLGTSEGYIPYIDFKTLFGLPWGIKLTGNSSEKMFIRISDDVSGVDEFDIVAYGFELEPRSK